MYWHLSLRTPNSSSPELATLENAQIMKILSDNIPFSHVKQPLASTESYPVNINNILESLLPPQSQKSWQSHPTFLEVTPEVCKAHFELFFILN